MHSFEVHSNESACRKKVRLGLEQVNYKLKFIIINSYEHFKLIELTPKSTPFETFDEIHKVVLDGISENMASLVQSVMYSAIKTDDTATNGFYVIQFLPEEYTLQNNTTIYGQVIYAGKLVVKAQYI